MNLACLVMTLICLVTILLFSGGGSGNGNSSGGLIARKGQAGETAELSGSGSGETIDSLESQQLVGSRELQAALSGENSHQLQPNEESYESSRKDSAKFRRKSEHSALGNQGNGQTGSKANVIERELESEDGAPSQANGDTYNQELPEPNRSRQPDFQAPISAGSLVEQLFSDSEMGPLLRALAGRATGGGGATNRSSPGSLRSIIRRGRNGATIIISSGTFNESSPLNESLPALLPSLLERLLPPLLRPMSLSSLGRPSVTMSDGNASGLLGSASIAIGAEPLPFPATARNPFGAPFASLSSPFAGFNGQPSHHHPSMFIGEPPAQLPPIGLSRQSSFGPQVFGPQALPFAMPHPSLLSMLMQANQLAPMAATTFDEELSQERLLGPRAQALSSVIESAKQESQRTPESGSNNKSETLTAQASQTSNSTGAQTVTKPSVSGNDSEIETVDVAHLSRQHNYNKMHNLYQTRARPNSGSMLIFSSTGQLEGPFQTSGPFGAGLMSPPFMSMAPHQMVLLGSGAGGLEGQSGGGPLSPMLRSILGGVLGELSAKQAAPSGEPTNKAANASKGGERNHQVQGAARASSSLVPNWSTWSSGDLEEEWASGNPNEASDRWDEQAQTQSSKNLRARHRDEELDSGTSEQPDFVSSLQLDQSNQAPAFASPFDRQLESGMVAGTIRQTIRGPGMTVERIIEVPSGRVQQVAPGVRSQSLSRSDVDETESVHGFPARFPASVSMISRPNGDDFAPPAVGFISKLLADISRRSDQSSPRGRGQFVRNHSLDEDLEEHESNGNSDEYAAPSQTGPKMSHLWPKIRVASARVRVRPLAEPRSSLSPALDSGGSIFMAPTQLTMSDLGQERDRTAERPASGLNQAPSEQKGPAAATFEDTLNSMEDRLNQVLSMGSHRGAVGEQRPSSQQQTEPDMANRLAAGRGQSLQPIATQQPDSPPNAIPMPTARLIEPVKLPGSLETSQPIARSGSQLENPFTSPASPLFGFPSSSLAHGLAPADNSAKSSKQATILMGSPASNQNANTNHNNNNNGNRQQRSFTYHSNNELASAALAPKQALQRRDQLAGADSNVQARFLAPPPPPTGAIMGRRLDDSPAFNPIETRHANQQQLLNYANPQSGARSFNENRDLIAPS